VDEDLHERMKAAAAADRRSLANWAAVACERAVKASDERLALDTEEASR
jgi:predicted HicB family RNase H-like nuclease